MRFFLISKQCVESNTIICRFFFIGNEKANDPEKNCEDYTRALIIWFGNSLAEGFRVGVYSAKLMIGSALRESNYHTKKQKMYYFNCQNFIANTRNVRGDCFNWIFPMSIRSIFIYFKLIKSRVAARCLGIF